MSSLHALLNPMSSGPPSPVALVGARRHESPPPLLIDEQELEQDEQEDELEQEQEDDEGEEEDSKHLKQEEMQNYEQDEQEEGERYGSDQEGEEGEEGAFVEAAESEKAAEDDDDADAPAFAPPNLLVEDMLEQVMFQPPHDDDATITDDQDAASDDDDAAATPSLPAATPAYEASPPPTPMHVDVERHSSIPPAETPVKSETSADDAAKALDRVTLREYPAPPAPTAALEPAAPPPPKTKPKKKPGAPRKKGLAKTAVKRRRVEAPSDPEAEFDDDAPSPPPPPAPKPRGKPGPKPGRRKKVDVDVDMDTGDAEWGANGPKYDDSGAVLYCICRKPDSGKWMIGCDGCDEWYHGECIHVKEEDGDLIDKYYCPHCKSDTQQTTWRRRCRLAHCRQPANVAAAPPSKYCTPAHGVAFMQQQLARATVPPSHLAALVAHTPTLDAFHALGERIPTPPPAAAAAASPLHTEELSRLLEIAQERVALEARRRLLESRRRYLPLALERRKRVWEELKAEGEGVAAPCGFDERFAMDDADWEAWCGEEEGERVFADAALEGRGGVCVRKRCNKHLRWPELMADELAVAERLRKERLVVLKGVERRIRERQKRRAVKMGSEGSVVVDGAE
ncbi:hypothetical protein EDC01DRAFT_779247 [Geopyxis carbonaria]|nr:hypothetical protein EDC01DRAFT_779247 [Geopyxis carbonaria]